MKGATHVLSALLCQCYSFSLLFPSGRGGRRCPAVRLSPSWLTWLFSVPPDKGENGEPYQRRKGAGASLPDGPPAFPTARDSAPTAGSSSWRRIMLMILAITIHNIPGKSCPSVRPSQLAGSLFPGSVPSWEDRTGLLPSLRSSFPCCSQIALTEWVPGCLLTRSVMSNLAPLVGLSHVRSWQQNPSWERGSMGSLWAQARCCILNICSPAHYCQPVVGENCKPESVLRKMTL